MKTALHWFRRDLRITDNTALTACSQFAERLVPAYVVSSWRGTHRWTGSHRQEFLSGSLQALDQNLRAIGSRLIVRRGDAVEELLRLARESGARAIFFNRDPDPFGRAVEARLAREAKAMGIEIVSCKDHCLHERDEVLNGSGEPFRVFTPYAKAWAKLPREEPRGRLRALTPPPPLDTLDVPSLETWGLKKNGGIVTPGEKAARRRLENFLQQGLAAYGDRRDLPAGGGTSRISQDLRYGLLSIREVVSRCLAKMDELPASARAQAQKYVSELIWREFYFAILWHFPDVLEQEFNPKFRGMHWPGREEHFLRWQAGETGFPIVDAAMRELKETGFMHNRTRMIAAMFLTKDLHLDWRLGEHHFMQQLTDGEIASNNGGWQWSAGTGADAAPYFRIQNPWTQTRRFDPEGAYIKRWVPELRDVPAELFFQAPQHGRIAARYPTPVVDHAVAREKTLQLFDRQKSLSIAGT